MKSSQLKFDANVAKRERKTEKYLKRKELFLTLGR